MKSDIESDVIKPIINTRFFVGGLASIGAMETAYLTWSKLSSSPLAGLCSIITPNDFGSPSCLDVLNSPYAMIPFINVPLSAVGFAAYSVVALMALAPILNGRQEQSMTSLNPTSNSLPLIFLTMSMAACSVYLMGLLAFVLHAFCPYCYLSAFISFAIAILASSLDRNSVRVAIVSFTSASMTLLTSAFMFYSIGILDSNAASNPLNGNKPDVADIASNKIADNGKKIEDPKAPPPLAQHSTTRSLALAQELKNLDARMYGAYWCSHCFNQKQNLGIEAKEYYEYIECDRDGLNSQYPLCKSKKIPGYPTWEIRGNLYPGEKSVEELQRLVSDIQSQTSKSASEL